MAKEESKLKIHTISLLLKLLKDYYNYDNLLFRGDNKVKKLRPRISECKPKNGMSKIQFERNMINEFMRQSLPLTEFTPKSKWDWLSLAQHHGMATRLLDWTLNPLAALWFAINRSMDNDGIMWIFIPKDEDYLDPEVDKDPFEIRRTKIFKPRHISRRISAQTGWFTAHWYNSKTDNYAALDQISDYHGQIEKFTFDKKAIPSLRKELDTCGINASSMFPDLDGLTKYIEWRNSI